MGERKVTDSDWKPSEFIEQVRSLSDSVTERMIRQASTTGISFSPDDEPPVLEVRAIDSKIKSNPNRVLDAADIKSSGVGVRTPGSLGLK